MGTVGNEDVWFAFAPKEFFDDQSGFKYLKVGEIKSDSRMSYQLYCQSLLFLAYVMSKNQVDDVILKPSNQWNEDLATVDGVTALTNLL